MSKSIFVICIQIDSWFRFWKINDRRIEGEKLEQSYILLTAREEIEEILEYTYFTFFVVFVGCS